MSKIAIVSVGYNRPYGMKRLWNDLLKADYENDSVTLVISLDKSDIQPELIKLAEEFEWPHGEKIIRAFPERQGLRPHIISCGRLTEEYDAVIIFEDDLLVSPQFYRYTKRMLEFYGDDERIAGISLYKHLLQVDSNRPFLPESDGSFTYMMQYAQSWGQCWNKRMWSGFYSWYTSSHDKPMDLSRIPGCVNRWDEHSWMKYFMRYLAVSDKYFVYPRVSLTSCYADEGQHGGGGINDYQVPTLTGETDFFLKPFDTAVKYDIFFERMGVPTLVEGRKMCVDLYGSKRNYTGFDVLASTNVLPFKVIKTVGLVYRPQEKNLITPTEGNGIFIYDLSVPDKKPKSNGIALTNYDIRTVSWKRALKYGLDGLKKSIMRRVKRLVKL